MKDVSVFSDLLDLFGFFIPGAFAMLVLAPLIGRFVRSLVGRLDWGFVPRSQFITITLLIMCAITLGVLTRGPSSFIQSIARRSYAGDPLGQAAAEAVRRHFNRSNWNDETTYMLVLTIADETSVAPDNERFNRLLLFTRNMCAVSAIAAACYLLWGVLYLFAAGGRPRGVGLLLWCPILLAVAAAFYFSYRSLQQRSFQAVCAQCLYALNPPPGAKPASPGDSK